MVRTLLLILCATPLLAQVESFDIYRFTTPPGWKLDRRANEVALTEVNGQRFCQIGILPSAPTLGSPMQDFEKDWDALIRQLYGVKLPPQPRTGTLAPGWTVLTASADANASGTGRFQSQLRTYSGNGLRATILMNGNHDGCRGPFEGFLTNLRLEAPAAAPPPAAPPTGGSEILADHVRLSRGGHTVLIFFAIPLDNALRNGSMLENFWNRLLASQYRAQRFIDSGERGAGFTENMTVHAREIRTGANVFIGLAVPVTNGTALPVAIVSRDETAYRQAIRDSEALVNLRNWNSFVVTPQQLVGKWTSSFASAAELYSVATSQYAGLQVAAASLELTFDAAGRYTSRGKATLGQVGALQTSTDGESGTFQIQNGELTLRPAGGKEPTVYVCDFEAVQGGMKLRIMNKRFTSSRWQLFRAK